MKINFSFAIILLFLCSEFSPAIAEDLLVRHIRPEGKYDQRNDYYIAMLKLALEKTKAQQGPYRLKMHEKRMLQARALLSVANKQFIDVVWTMTSIDRERRLLPIRIPLLKGLLGHRIFIIRERDKAKYKKIQSLGDLRVLIAGQGHDWPDVSILEENGLPVVTGTDYDGLFAMLKAGRFDYFPRGLNEPWFEVKARRGNGFVVEDSLLLKYPAPIYFFVHLDNSMLAQRIEKGLRLAIDDGSFNEIFQNHPANQEIFKIANFEHRRVFALENPLLSDETPLDDPKLWYSPTGKPR